MLAWQDSIQLGDNKAPGVATDLVQTAFAKGKVLLESVKKGRGYLGWAVGKAEVPVAAVLDSGIGKAAVTMGERFVKLADRTVDGTINSAVVKRSSEIFTDTFKNRVLPVTTAVSTKLTDTSAHVRSAVVAAKDKVVRLDARLLRCKALGTSPLRDELVANYKLLRGQVGWSHPGGNPRAIRCSF